MSRFKTRLLAPIVALLLVSASQVRAGNIDWSYSWTPSAPNLYGDSGTSGGYIAFTPNSAGGATNTSTIIATNLTTVSGASPNLPDQYNAGTGFYSLSLVLTDAATGQTNNGIGGNLQPLSFGGKLSGTFSDKNSLVTNQFGGFITQEVTLGANTYTVTIGPYTPPGPPNANNQIVGSIGAFVDVEPAVIDTKNAPEPSTMVLSLFGLTTVGAGWWRKRRAAAA